MKARREETLLDAYARAVRLNAPVTAALLAKRAGLPHKVWLLDAFRTYCRLCELGFEEQADDFARELGLTVNDLTVQFPGVAYQPN